MQANFREMPASDLAALVVAEYDLGTPVRIEPLGTAGHRTFKVLAPQGSFVLKPAGRPEDVDLFARVADLLNSRGILQARLVPTRTQTLMTSFGYILSEFLEGTTDVRPSNRQTIATMAHLGDYLRALAGADLGWRPDETNFWSRVAEVDYLLAALPRHLDDSSPEDRRALRTGLDYLAERADSLGRLDRQLVHGDVAPDNVVTNAEEVIAIIDFTPFWEPALFSVACALYWFHVHGNNALPIEAIATSLEVCGTKRPWSHEELAMTPTMLVREALRRLATALEAPAPMQVSRASMAARRQSLRLIVEALPILQDVAAI